MTMSQVMRNFRQSLLLGAACFLDLLPRSVEAGSVVSLSDLPVTMVMMMHP
jgi:hypothetical protein